MSAEPTSSTSEPHRARMGPVLAVGILAFIALTAVVSELRYLSLGATAWDLGIYQQALWSTSHGRPFYEAMDLETGGFGTLLQIHSAFVLYALVPVYAALPNPLTLFIVQSAAVALAAIPLYGIALSRVGRPRPAAALALLYLAWTPTVAGTVHDFHIEAFVPLVFLTTAYLWMTGRYAWGVVAAAVGTLTMEVVPGLLAALAVYLIVERAEPGLGFPGGFATWKARARRVWTDRASRYALGLLLASVVAYYLLLLVRYSLLPELLGTPPYPAAAPGGYAIGGTAASLGLSVTYLGTGLATKVFYWFLVLALVAFLPLLAPRTVILFGPPMLFSLLSWNVDFTVLGFQYGLLYAGPVFIGAAVGLPAFLERWDRAAGSPKRLLRLAPRHRLATACLLLIAVNLAISPLDPLVYAPDAGYGYVIGSGRPPASSGAISVAGLVPGGATVVASDDLFPLVANDVNAYSLFWRASSSLSLPFGLSDLPQFALLSEARLSAVPPWLSATVYDTNDYGLRGIAWGSPVGTVLLFERGFHASPAVWGAPPPATQVVWPHELRPTPGYARVVADPTAPLGEQLVSTEGATGLLWDGPGLSLAPGAYRFSFLVSVTAVGPTSPSPTDPVLTLASDAFGQPPLFLETFTYQELAGAAGRSVSFTVVLGAPTLSINVPGYALDPGVGVALDEVEVAPA